jgi:hypothetical protein
MSLGLIIAFGFKFGIVHQTTHALCGRLRLRADTRNHSTNNCILNFVLMQVEGLQSAGIIHLTQGVSYSFPRGENQPCETLPCSSKASLTDGCLSRELF